MTSSRNAVVLSFGDICRVCLRDLNDKVSLNTIVFDEFTVRNMIQSLCDLEIPEEDGFPYELCLQCYNNLINVYAFINLIKESDKSLKECFNQTVVEAEELLSNTIKMEVEDVKMEDFGEQTIVTEVEQEPEIILPCISIGDKLEHAKKKLLDDLKMTEELIISNSVTKSLVDNQKVEKKVEQCKTMPTFNWNNLKLFICKFCNQDFRTAGTLNRHNITQHNYKPFVYSATTVRGKPRYSCFVCDKKFAKKTFLHLHLSLRHRHTLMPESNTDMENVFYCLECDPHLLFNNTDDILNHLKLDHHFVVTHALDLDNKLDESNKVCTEVISDIESRTAPVEPVDGRWRCDQDGCKAHYSRKTALKYHYRKKHQVDKDFNKFKCPVDECGLSFVTSAKLINHGVVVHNKYLVEQDIVYKKILGEERSQEVTVPRLECDICKKRFNGKNWLRRHILQHFGQKVDESVMCSYCGLVVSQKSSLASHIAQKHEFKYVNCPLCQKKVKLHYLRRHYKRHANESGVSGPSYLCKECGKVLKTKVGFESHEKIHKNERDNICPICSLGFTHKTILKLHMQVHDGEDRVRFHCNKCSKVFNQRSTLTRHLLTHTGERNFICEICSKDFYTIQELNRHSKYHKDVFQFKCGKCSRAFREKSSYRIHLMRHNKVLPHACKLCDKRFVLRHKLTNHMRNRHDIESVGRGILKDPKTYIPLENLLEMK